MTSEILVHAGPDELAGSVASRLVSRLVDIQREGRVPSIVLTGGTVAAKLHRAVASSSARGEVDWSRVDFWFGDERFVPADDADRNAGQAAEALLDHLPVDPSRVHEMPASDGKYGDDVDAAAAGYAQELREAAVDGDTPVFDVVMLGVGPDGHCASLFPSHPALKDDRPAIPVRDSPKPPPTRISLSIGPLRRAREVWFVASGAEKAEAVRNAVTGSDVTAVPASGPKGMDATLWFVDEAAATHLPR